MVESVLGLVRLGNAVERFARRLAVALAAALLLALFAWGLYAVLNLFHPAVKAAVLSASRR